jgi:hypothetical protein
MFKNEIIALHRFLRKIKPAYNLFSFTETNHTSTVYSMRCLLNKTP